MIHRFRLLLPLLLPCLPMLVAAQGSPSSFVNPFVGTAAHGHTYPGAVLPFGMVQLSPDAGKSGWDWCSGYHYSDTALIGFSHTHLSGTGCADLGDILFMPTTSWRSVDRRYRSPFSHEREIAEPGYYRVHLLDHDIQVELTTTRRCGMHRYTFAGSDSARVIVDLGYGQDDKPVDTGLRMSDDRTMTGYRVSSGWAAVQRVFFAVRFSRPVFGMLDGNSGARVRSSEGLRGKAALAVLAFGRLDAGTPLIARVGISAVSEENALANLDAEMPDEDFDLARSRARTQWDDALRVTDAHARDQATVRTFSTALYHCMLAPSLYMDVDGRYRGGDDSVHTAEGFEHSTVFSLWDTYRALHPLFTILDPARVSDWTRSLMAFHRESGLLPVWTLHANETNCMIGYHSVPVLVDAILKGIAGVDEREALEAMKRSAEQPRGGLAYYSMARPIPLDSLLARNIPPPSLTSLPWNTIGAACSGYASTIAGSTLGYHSSHPEAHDALLTRATDTPMPIEWESAPVPESVGRGGVALCWLAGMATNKGAHLFTLSVNDTPLLRFRTPSSPDSAAFVLREGSAVLHFAADMVDQFGDLFGTMTLLLPRDMFTPGRSLRIRIEGERAGSQDWVMTFTRPFGDWRRASMDVGHAESAHGKVQAARIGMEHIGLPQQLTFVGDAGEPVHTTVYPGYRSVSVPMREATSEETRGIVIEDRFGKRLDSLSVTLRPAAAPRYIPADKENESVSKTLEYAYDDWCIAQLARALGAHDDAARFLDRSTYYTSLFDTDLGFMRGRNLDGSWRSPFNPRFSTLKQHEYTEGNAWQYTWYVPHDVDGLLRLMGGPEAFARKLDSLFEQSSDLEGTGATGDVTGLIGLYAHGNEPSHHIAYLYNYAGQPWKTQKLVRRIMREMYSDKPDGLIGNEDCGQMSAWYVFSAMGFYPVNPCGGSYDIGSPALDRLVINLGEGKQFIMHAENNSEENVYIQSATLNGQPLARPVISHADIMRGGTLHFVMGPRPSTLWKEQR